MGLRVDAIVEHFPIRGAFVISRERRTVQTVVRVTLDDEKTQGQAECVPYRHYGETPETVIKTILSQAEALASGMTLQELQDRLPPGAARNGLDCALWDYEAKKSGRRVWQLLSLPAPHSVETAQTLSLSTPQDMHAAARKLCEWPILKLKLGGAGDDERIEAVRAGAPKARLIVDANEAWTLDLYKPLVEACLKARVELIEQPFPAADDAKLAELPRPIPVCADESLHDRRGLKALKERYDAINIKLDKAGGLSEALALRTEAKAQGFIIFVGSMLATSLAVAPAVLLAQDADFVDLDPPLLLEKDRVPGLAFEGARIMPPPPELWG